MRETHLSKDRQTVKLGLIKVIRELFPEDRIKTAYSIQEGVFCRLNDSVLSIREVDQIRKRLDEWVESNSKIDFLGRKEGYFQYQMDGNPVSVLYPAHDYSSMVALFSIIPFSSGFIVDFGDAARGGRAPLIPPEKLSSNYDRNQSWLRNINMELIRDVNKRIEEGGSPDFWPFFLRQNHFFQKAVHAASGKRAEAGGAFPGRLLSGSR